MGGLLDLLTVAVPSQTSPPESPGRILIDLGDERSEIDGRLAGILRPPLVSVMSATFMATHSLGLFQAIRCWEMVILLPAMA